MASSSKPNRKGNRTRRTRVQPGQREAARPIAAEISPEREPAPSAPSAPRLRAIRNTAAPGVDHVSQTRDYGYVRGELLRIAFLAALIFAVIVLIAAFWD